MKFVKVIAIVVLALQLLFMVILLSAYFHPSYYTINNHVYSSTMLPIAMFNGNADTLEQALEITRHKVDSFIIITMIPIIFSTVAVFVKNNLAVCMLTALSIGTTLGMLIYLA